MKLATREKNHGGPVGRDSTSSGAEMMGTADGQQAQPSSGHRPMFTQSVMRTEANQPVQ